MTSGTGRRPQGAPPYVSYALVRVAHLLEQRMDRLLADLGLSATGFGALFQLQNDPDVSSAELARRILVTPQSIGPLLARLERDGLVDRRSAGVSGTAIITRITMAGRERLTEAAALVQAIENDLVGALDRTQRSELDDQLWEMLERLVRVDHEAPEQMSRLSPTQRPPTDQSPTRTVGGLTQPHGVASQPRRPLARRVGGNRQGA